jgi:hypothetical protein
MALSSSIPSPQLGPRAKNRSNEARLRAASADADLAGNVLAVALIATVVIACAIGLGPLVRRGPGEAPAPAALVSAP